MFVVPRPLVGALLCCACLLPAAVQAQVEFKMISSGPNRPAVAIWMSPNREIVAGLHADVPGPGIAAMLGLTRAGLQARIDSMAADGTIRIVAGRPRPSCMVITAEDGEQLARLASEIATSAMPMMRRLAAMARTRHRDIPGLRSMSFDDVSFFLVSDVLLDNWQIGAVERQWLQAERPRRGQSRYYCSLQARTDPHREAFRLYGNNARGLEDGRVFGVYGNRRGGPADLSALSQQRLAGMLGRPDSTNRQALLGALADELIRIHSGDHSNAALLEALNGMDVLRDGRPRFAVLDSADSRRLEELAATVTADLVRFLQSVTPRLRQAWQASPWHDEITFEEYAIWWYHFFYTAVTDQLAGEGVIHVPDSGLFHYVLHD